MSRYSNHLDKNTVKDIQGFKASGEKANRYYINANLVSGKEMWDLVSKHPGAVVVA